MTLCCRYYADEDCRSLNGSFDVESIISVNQQQVCTSKHNTRTHEPICSEVCSVFYRPVSFSTSRLCPTAMLNVYGLCLFIKLIRHRKALLRWLMLRANSVLPWSMFRLCVCHLLQVPSAAIPAAPNCRQVLSGRVYEFMFQSLDSAVKVL